MNNSGIINPNIPEKPEVMPTPTSTNPNKWLKVGLLGLAGLLVVAVLVYAGYWYGTKSEKLKAKSEKVQPQAQNLTPTKLPIPTPTLTSNLTIDRKIYKDPIYRFTFSFPKEWEFESCMDILCGSLKDAFNKELIKVSGFGADCGVTPNPSFENAERAVMCGCDAFGVGVAISCDSPTEQKIITTNESAIGYSFLMRHLVNDKPSGSRGPYAVFFFPKPMFGGGALYEYGVYLEALDANIIPEFNQTLSTFRFLE